MYMKPNRVAAVQQLKEPDKGKYLTYCQWLQALIMDGILDPLLFMMEEA